MPRRIAIALGALSLGWLAGAAPAADPPASPPQPLALDKPAAAAPAPVAPAPASSAPVVLQPGDGACCGHECEHGSHLIGGAGFYLMQAFPGSDPALTTTHITATTTVATGATSTVTQGVTTEFSHDYSVAPLIWLGYVGDSGLGFRARWWRYDESSSASAVNPTLAAGPAVPVNGVITIPTMTISSASVLGLSFTSLGSVNGPEQVLATNNIRLNVWDFEATQDFHRGCWTLGVSAGLRYAMLNQSYAAARVGFTGLLPPQFQDGDGDDAILNDENVLLAHHSFNGIGPTASLDIHRPIRNSGFALYGTARGSILFGRSHQSALTLSHFQFAETDPADAAENVDTATSSSLVTVHDQVMPVAEVEAGAEWSRHMGRFVPFVRVGVVAQSWFDAGSATDLNGDLGFFGMTLTAGLTF
jgi:hypothetical protein